MDTPAAGPRSIARHAALCGVASVLLVFLFQFLVVRYNYAGNWTSLFCAGDRWKLPPELAPRTYLFPRSDGYDGQMYRIVAHDPFLAKGYAVYLDTPVMRYRRILVPMLAWLLGFGRTAWIDPAFIAVILAFTFLGAFWLGLLSAAFGRSPRWGLLFVMVPSTPLSAERMVIDVVPTALCVALAYCLWRESAPGVWLALASLQLTRETGILLVAPCVVFALLRKDLPKAALWASALIPAFLWEGFVHWRAPAGVSQLGAPEWVFRNPELGILARLFHPPDYPFRPPFAFIGQLLDTLALAGMIIALVLTAWIVIDVLRKRSFGVVELALVFEFGLFLFINRDLMWVSVWGYGRLFGILFVLLYWKLAAAKARRPLALLLAATALVDLRIALDFAPKLLGIVRGLRG